MFRTLSIALAFLAVPAVASAAETEETLARQGYQVVWSGYAPITTCVHDQDAYPLGPYIFACDKFTYEYPYHYGTVRLAARQFELEGRQIWRHFMCLDGKNECLEGTIYAR